MANTTVTFQFLGEKIVKAAVILYIDPHKKTCYTQISLAYHVDQWWCEKQGYTTMQLTVELPLYLALFVKDAIAAKLRGKECSNWLDADLKSLTRDWISETIAKLGATWKNHFEKLWNKANHSSGDASTISIDEIEIIQEDARLILPYIEGRRWLFEHLEKRLKVTGVRLTGASYNEQKIRTYLQTVLQYLFLQKEIEITSGVALRHQQGNLQVQCERCGSTEYGINLHYCSMCDHDDFVCDTCFVMGVSKGCSLVISRAKMIDHTLQTQNKQIILKSATASPVSSYWAGDL